ncbi:peptidylprolyl isomerase [Bacterioplanes sanyensis]|uniref:peptidylprolyl isomerase n=1 Tax=Bacterioplanes sanyensis TaxID=1249553 RepID=UPI001674171C|nr:peptidylprolyl isomerase [Bacterioplanes sanyensis]GGY38317.1 peptidylprolyl isomerase [Bacterioplanes sanyensis]
MSIALHHILLRSEWLARDLLQELHLGANFEDLAVEHSVCPSSNNQGFAGYHDPDQLPVTLANALHQWDGETVIIGPIPTDFGFHLLKPTTLPPRPLINDDATLSE